MLDPRCWILDAGCWLEELIGFIGLIDRTVFQSEICIPKSEIEKLVAGFENLESDLLPHGFFLYSFFATTN